MTIQNSDLWLALGEALRTLARGSGIGNWSQLQQLQQALQEEMPEEGAALNSLLAALAGLEKQMQSDVLLKNGMQAGLSNPGLALALHDCLQTIGTQLRLPLQAVVAGCDLLQREAGRSVQYPGQNQHLLQIQAACSKVQQVIGNWLDLAQIQSGQAVLQNECCNLLALLEGLRREFAPLASERHLSLVLEVSPNLPTEVWLAKDTVRQILQKLLRNALSHTWQGRVSLLVMQQAAHDGRGPGLQFVVSDTGIGIPYERQERVWRLQNWEQVSEGRGLAACQLLARAMDGRLMLESQVARGTRVCFDLPLLLHGQAEGKVLHGLVEGAFAGRRVLLVRDGGGNQRMITQLFRHSGVALHVVTGLRQDLPQTLAQMEKRGAGMDLLILDMQHPPEEEQGSLALIRAIREQGLQLPLLAISDLQSEQQLLQYLAAGVNQVLGKPLVLMELVDALQQSLNRKSSPSQTASMAAEPVNALESGSQANPETGLRGSTRLEAGTTSSLSVPGIDLEQALPRFMNRLDLLLAARDAFLIQHRECCNQLANMLANQAWSKIFSLANVLRGGAGNIGANAVKDCAIRIEGAAQRADAVSLSALIDKLAIAMLALGAH